MERENQPEQEFDYCPLCGHIGPISDFAETGICLECQAIEERRDSRVTTQITTHKTNKAA